jgi:hypothetical protein
MGHSEGLGELLIGYVRVSTGERDLAAQRDTLAGLGVELERIHLPTSTTD